MWIMVYGATGTGKHSIVELLTKRTFELLEAPPPPDDFGDFEKQLEYLVSRTRVHLQAQAIMNRKDVVTIRGPYDTHEVFNKILFASERITLKEFEHLKTVYNGLFPTLEPPHCAVWCHASPMSAISRMSLRNKSVNQAEFNQQLVSYKTFFESIRVPQIEVDLDQTMDEIVKDFEFNVASLKTTAVSAQTLWKREFYRGEARGV